MCLPMLMLPKDSIKFVLITAISHAHNHVFHMECVVE